MANITKGLLTTYGSTSQVESNYFFVISGTGYVPRYTTSSYIFIGRVEPWINENDPDSPTQNQIVLKYNCSEVVDIIKYVSSCQKNRLDSKYRLSVLQRL
jgi:hypothetical protein